ncbi:superoxide dismutase [Bernardetia sp.]|uniref:superoxide dismutase n=1 Tax=Bernardetia sp. TaxID=1937974 RepID=UPI0025BA3E4A|nr:superoxide dismutase [Bernardetia sp.]
MDKRTFLKTASLATIGIILNPLSACDSSNKDTSKVNADSTAVATENGLFTLKSPFELPALPYEFAALAPNIDKQTMEIHHGKHHHGYVNKLNAAIEGTKFSTQNLREILESIGDNDTAVRNNGGGHYNHSLFWESLSPKNQVPTENLKSALEKDFGSYEAFKKAFTEEAKGVFGSGWAWLCKAGDGKLFITSTPNQDNPLMKNLVDETGTPILGLDVWEHAYYLNYQNKRGDYIENFYKVINWEKVEERFKA